jgi:acyl-CoA synthetase (AMP-forming)/AMP-acid ligase II|tara:strand:+ start:243 stop:1610 length:1368 start_codon:yes stop_codon:yes gene_type:complete
MKNISLSNSINKVSNMLPERLAISSSLDEIYYHDLARLIPRSIGKSVILYFYDITKLISTMVLLDGYVETLCPISEQIDDDDLKHIILQKKFDVVITDIPLVNLDLFIKYKISIYTFDKLNLNINKKDELFQKQTKWLVPTSGTTSKPKLVQHTISSLTASAVSSKVEKREIEVWGLFYDPTRYAGYQVLFKSLLNGHTLVAPSLSKSIADRVQVCIDKKVTHISATPTLWRKILMCPLAKKMALKKIVLGGEAADQPTLDALRKMYPKSKITHVYASTEAGAAMSVSDGLAGFPIFFLDNNDAKIKMKIEDNHLYLKSTAAASSYIGQEKFQNSDGWINTGDLVTKNNDRFFVIGRANGVINIGGDKVFPEKVRHILLELKEVEDVFIYGKKNPFTGMLLVADIKISSDTDHKSAEQLIKNFIKESIPVTHQPKIIRIVNEIETNSTGKVGLRR